MQTEQARLRGSAAPARHPSRGLPSRSSRCGVSSREQRMVAHIFTSSNPLISWLRQIEAFKSGVSGVSPAFQL